MIVARLAEPKGAFDRGAAISAPLPLSWTGEKERTLLNEMIAICDRVSLKTAGTSALLQKALDELRSFCKSLIESSTNKTAYEKQLASCRVTFDYYVHEIFDWISAPQLEGEALETYLRKEFHAPALPTKQEPAINVHAFDVDPAGDQSKQPGQATMFE